MRQTATREAARKSVTSIVSRAAVVCATVLGTVLFAGVLTPATARPTDGTDPRGDQYTTTNIKMKCATHICVHWAAVGGDKPVNNFQDTALKEMEKIWKFEVSTMGYRPPPGDGSRGGNSKLDVYLKDLGPKGYTGYCDKEKTVNVYLSTSYCVFDNDFNPSQYGGRNAMKNFQSAASHEFFHAVQRAYDADEDGWLRESTASWMEERYVDAANYNRDYLSNSVLSAPNLPLDINTSGSGPQFGAWIWWEYLTERYGNGIVKKVWIQAGEYPGAGHSYSTAATRTVLQSKGGFKKQLANFMAGNLAPGKSYQEGASWNRPAALAATYTLGLIGTTGPLTATIDHLAANNIRFIPSSAVTGANQRIRIDVDGPDSLVSPMAVVTVWKSTGPVRSTITLDANGVGHGTYLFDASQVAHVTLTLINGSTRSTCWNRPNADPGYSCQGTPIDEAKAFTYSATNLAV